jgi:hypothetical protein
MKKVPLIPRFISRNLNIFIASAGISEEDRKLVKILADRCPSGYRARDISSFSIKLTGGAVR